MNRKDCAMEYTVDLWCVIKRIWRYPWAIALAGMLSAALGFCYASFCIAPTYESSVMLYVNNHSASDGTISSSQISAAQSLVDTYCEILNSRTTLERVVEKAGVFYEYDEISDMIRADSANGTEIMRVTVTAKDPHEAARIANAVAEVLPVRISEIVDGASMKLVDGAVPNQNKVSPSVTSYTAIAFMLGALLAAGTVTVLALTDRKAWGEKRTVSSK